MPWSNDKPTKTGVYRTYPGKHHKQEKSLCWQSWNGRFWGQYCGSENQASNPVFAETRSCEQNPTWFDDTEERKDMIDITRPAKTKNGYTVTFISDKGRGAYPILGYIDDNTAVSAWTSTGECSNPQCRLVQESAADTSFDPGKRVVTRDGRPVQVRMVDGRGDYPVKGYVGDSEKLEAWTYKGEFLKGGNQPSPDDLVNECEVWIRFNRNGSQGMFNTPPLKDGTTLAIKRVKWAPGQFDT